uniref:BING4CT domain-containing protein n=1 Tax=Panagrellus redivivus TaxID=6233 RepID=A0A7E4ZV75_PANRE
MGKEDVKRLRHIKKAPKPVKKLGKAALTDAPTVYAKRGQNAVKKEIDEAQILKNIHGHAGDAVVLRAKAAEKINPNRARDVVTKAKLKTHKKRIAEGIAKTAEAELLNTEEAGYLKTDDGSLTYNVKQAEITSSIDLATATRSFSLDLEHGPYRFDYGINGRELILGGRRGHIGVFDWMTKDLLLEKDLLESVKDVSFLHVSTLFAAAQRRWVHLYDEQGIELHCMKQFNEPKLLQFLPRHLLLSVATGTGYLHYLDITSGKIVNSFRMKEHGNPGAISLNQSNGVLLSGGHHGQVTMWTPNAKEPLVSIKAHTSSITGLTVDHLGNYFASSGSDGLVKLFDIRTYKQLSSYKVRGRVSCLDLSQRHNLALGIGQHVQVFQHVNRTSGLQKPYLSHFVGGDVRQVQFCAHEDVLGIGHERGFASILVPGSGDPDMAGLLHNPFESKAQRREREVKMLLDKIQPNMIALDPSTINRVRKAPEKVIDVKPAYEPKPDPTWALLHRFKRR